MMFVGNFFKPFNSVVSVFPFIVFELFHKTFNNSFKY